MKTQQRSTSSSTDPLVRREVVLGADTHGEVHVAAVVSPLGKILGTESFPATAAGYRQLLAWARERGTVRRSGRFPRHTTPRTPRPTMALRDPISGAGHPQMLLRLGYGPKGPRTPRRPVSDALDVQPRGQGEAGSETDDDIGCRGPMR